MILRCYKYQWQDFQSGLNNNYFNPDTKTFIESIDLDDYLIQNGLSPVSFSSYQIDENNKLFREAGSVNLKCSNILKGYSRLNSSNDVPLDSLQEFFEVFNFSESFLFILQISEDERSNPIWTGVIERQGISFNSRSNETLEITAISIDKAFADYYANETIPAFSELPTFPLSAAITQTGQEYTRLTAVIAAMFPGVATNLNSDHFAFRYFIARRPYIYSPVSNTVVGKSFLCLPSGYECFELDKQSKYDFLQSVCLSMGWQWYFDNDVLTITKLSGGDSEEIDFADFISHGYSVAFRNAVNTVIVESGEFYGARNAVIDTVSTAMNALFFETNIGVPQTSYYYLGGTNYKIYDGSTNPLSNSNIPFSSLALRFIIGGAVYDRIFTNLDVALKGDNEIENFYSRKIINDVVPTSWQALDELSYSSFPASNAIVIKPTLPTGNSSAHLDLSQARTSNNQFYGNGNAFNVAQDPGNNGIYMRGCIGYAMLRLTEDLKYEDYDYYTNSQEWRDNMRTLTGNAYGIEMQATVSGVVNHIGKKLTFIDYPYAQIGDKEFICTHCEIDLLNNSTKITANYYG